jgi:hypothetical protein
MHGRRGREEQKKNGPRSKSKKPGHDKKGMPWKVKYDPTDPATWPASFKRQEEKVLYFFDILMGETRTGSPKGRFLDTVFEDKHSVTIAVDRQMMEVIADIEGMYKMGGFGNIPLSVAEKWVGKYRGKMPFNADDLSSTLPDARGWTPTSVIRMSLEIFRYYLMGTCPMTRKIIRNVMRLNDRPISLHQIANAVERAADFEDALELDD